MRTVVCAAVLAICSQAVAQDLDAALQLAERLVREQPTAEHWQKLGLARYLQNQFEPATQAFQQALQRDPRLWPAHLFLGISRYRLNQFRPALASLEHAHRLAPATGPGRDDLDYWLGATHIALRSPLPGLAALERLLARNPTHAPALQLATETYADAASALWNRVADQEFTSSAGQEVHGHARESEGNRADALAAFQEAARLAPSRPGPHVALARLHLQAGAVAEAATAVTRALALDPASPEANLYAGLIAVRQNRLSDAVAPLTLASRWRTDNEEPLLALAQVYLSLRDAAKAVAAARRAVAIDARSPAAHELLLAALQAAADTAGITAEQDRWRTIR